MKLPELSELGESRDAVDVFGGYNHNLRIGDGEFYDMKNLTSLYYPVLAPRQSRGVYCNTESEPLGLIEKDALCYIRYSGTHLYFNMNGNDYDLGITEIGGGTERTLISMGAYVIVMPDKKYFNTKDETDKGDIEAYYPLTEQTPESAYTAFTLCNAEGEEYSIDISAPEEPQGTDENPLENGYTWLDTSVSPPSLKTYSSASGLWSSVATTYIKITSYKIDESFSQYDGITITGVDTDSKSLNEALNNKTHVIYAKGKNEDTEEEEGKGWIVVVGILDNPGGYEQNGWITVKRQMPAMDFIVESNNRLWGCRYGLNNEGKVVNELYASKLGDFKNWNCFMGISTDSYYVSLGTDGQFTGAIAYLGYPTFFKENCMHTVYGSFPAEYQVQDTACRGVQKGSEKSLAMVNEVLYYKSRTGICAYSGSLPAEISAALGEKAYSDAVGCAYQGKYYISMKDLSEGKFVLFVYDTEKGLWHKEDELYVKQFCAAYPAELNGEEQISPVKEEIYYTDGTQSIKTIFGSGTPEPEKVSWMAETGILGLSSPDKKYISRLSVRLSTEAGSRIVFYAEYNSSGVWEHLCTVGGNTLKTFTLPIRPKRCDHFRLRIKGEGNAKIFSISRITEQGSDI